ncbi:hypothetical protein BD289DRAFT_283406 [Coniella lustricola]|uniref:Uncharacterized protein n=1 Tax=Coniella lustricola TaxID=2025994 RepID=A0A2T3AK56_9PEZI|nr:hypothetical protein BD289DRAFT_283406 [Coniella lustricola]
MQKQVHSSLHFWYRSNTVISQRVVTGDADGVLPLWPSFSASFQILTKQYNEERTFQEKTAAIAVCGACLENQATYRNMHANTQMVACVFADSTSFNTTHLPNSKTNAARKIHQIHIRTVTQVIKPKQKPDLVCSLEKKKEKKKYLKPKPPQ